MTYYVQSRTACVLPWRMQSDHGRASPLALCPAQQADGRPEPGAPIGLRRSSHAVEEVDVRSLGVAVHLGVLRSRVPPVVKHPGCACACQARVGTLNKKLNGLIATDLAIVHLLSETFDLINQRHLSFLQLLHHVGGLFGQFAQALISFRSLQRQRALAGDPAPRK